MTRTNLPQRRTVRTVKVTIDGMKVILKTGEYQDGRLGEIAVQVGREGDSLNAMLDLFCKAVSMGLQHGVPLEKLVDSFTFVRFPPSGMVIGHDKIKMASSIIDFIFREVGITYLKRKELGSIKSDE